MFILIDILAFILALSIFYKYVWFELLCLVNCEILLQLK